MKQKQLKKGQQAALYNATTDPVLTAVTTPLPRTYQHTPTRPLPNQQRWQQQSTHHKKTILQVIVGKINKLLGFIVLLLFILLTTRLLFTLFGLVGSLFSHWVYQLSQPLITPFTDLLPTVTYQGYAVEWSVVCTFVVYSLAIVLFARLLKVLTD